MCASRYITWKMCYKRTFYAESSTKPYEITFFFTFLLYFFLMLLQDTGSINQWPFAHLSKFTYLLDSLRYDAASCFGRCWK